MRRFTTTGLAILAGAAIGTAAGLLFAPEPGRRTRRKVRYYSKRAQVRAALLGEDLKDRIDRLVDFSRKLVA